MFKYAKIVNSDTGLCSVGLGSNEKYFKSVGMKLLDVEQSDIDFQWYLIDKCPMKTDKQKETDEIEKQINKINEELSDLDIKRIRAICEPEIRNEETGETWLDYYNSQILSLRGQIQQLKERMNENDITI